MKIQYLELFTHVPDALKSFYTEVLDFELISSDQKSFQIQAGATQLVFKRVEEPEIKPFYHFAFNIPENQIEQALNWTRKKVEIVKWKDIEVHDFVNWNAHAFYFFDPAGNIVEFIARHDLDNWSDTQFSARSVTTVSEIGLVGSQIEPVFQQLNTQYYIPLYSGNMDTFCAAGDPDGLFIIVPQKRLWFPVDIPNDIYPLKVIFQGINSGQWEPKEYPYIIESILM